MTYTIEENNSVGSLLEPLLKKVTPLERVSMGDWNWTLMSSLPSSMPSLNIGFAGTGETGGQTGFLFLLSQLRACTGIRSLLFCSARPFCPQFPPVQASHGNALLVDSRMLCTWLKKRIWALGTGSYLVIW
jgi:hypothetical protein